MDRRRLRLFWEKIARGPEQSGSAEEGLVVPGHVLAGKQAWKDSGGGVHQQQRSGGEASGDPELHHFGVIANSLRRWQKGESKPGVEKRGHPEPGCYWRGRRKLQPLYAKGNGSGRERRNIETPILLAGDAKGPDLRWRELRKTLS